VNIDYEGTPQFITKNLEVFMSTISVLKITYNNNIVLLSRCATQDISLNPDYKIIQNINGDLIKHSFTASIRCTIKTFDTPNVSLLHPGEKYKIYSVTVFKSTQKPTSECVLDYSRKVGEEYI